MHCLDLALLVLSTATSISSGFYSLSIYSSSLSIMFFLLKSDDILVGLNVGEALGVCSSMYIRFIWIGAGLCRGDF